MSGVTYVTEAYEPRPKQVSNTPMDVKLDANRPNTSHAVNLLLKLQTDRNPYRSAVQSQYGEVCTSLHFETHFTALRRILQHEVHSTSLEVLHFTRSISKYCTADTLQIYCSDPVDGHGKRLLIIRAHCAL